MSSEDDLKKYQRDQEVFFQELEENQRRSEQQMAASELSDVLERAGVRLEQFEPLNRQLLKLGRLGGMSTAAAKEWATNLIVEAIRLRLQSSLWTSTQTIVQQQTTFSRGSSTSSRAASRS